jgi:hypothetical protein
VRDSGVLCACLRSSRSRETLAACLLLAIAGPAR